MTIACNRTGCYYYYRGLCSNKLTAIDENGMCEQVWHKGKMRPDGGAIGRGSRDNLVVLNVAKAKETEDGRIYGIGNEAQIDENSNQSDGRTD